MTEERPNPSAPFPPGEGGEGLTPPSLPGKRAGAPGVLLGIDYGTVRVGLAMCDPDRIIAKALVCLIMPGDAITVAM